MKYLLLIFLQSVCYAEFLPRSFQAEFEQQIVSAVTGKVKKTQGTLEYMFPSQLKFEIFTPDKKLSSAFYSNKSKSSLYTPPFVEGEAGNLIVQSSEKLFLSRFFDSMSHGLKNNELYDVKLDKNSLELIFKEKMQERIGIARAIFENVANPQKVHSLSELKELKIILSDSKEVKLVFTNFKTGMKFTSEHFVFKAPKNTKISEK
ncbi:MAG: hypothetical protein JNM93_01050 [Bacteriovoracaceae bacterium]|nr:hypothetical protein [Bacteriovoracaceae bacterium]